MGSQPSPFPCTTPLTIVCPYWRPDCVNGGRPSFPLKFALEVIHPRSKTTILTNIRTQCLNRESWRKKVQLVLIGSRSCHRRTMYVTSKSPKGSHENAILLFLPVKFNFCRKKSATKFLCVKTSISTVVATAFLYLTVHRWIATVHRWIAGDDPST